MLPFFHFLQSATLAIKYATLDALQETSEDAEPTSKNDSPELKEPTSILWAKLEKRKSDIKLSKKNDRKEIVDLEMTKYLKMAAHEVQTNPLKWWCFEGRKMFPLLYEVAAKLFIIPATSVPSERVISVSGFVLRKQRRRFGQNNVNMVVRLHQNADVSDDE